MTEPLQQLLTSAASILFAALLIGIIINAIRLAFELFFIGLATLMGILLIGGILYLALTIS